MLQKPRGRKSFKTKLTGYILLLTILSFAILLINSLLLSGKPLFVSPMGKNNVDTKKVEKILKDNNIALSPSEGTSVFSGVLNKISEFFNRILP